MTFGILKPNTVFLEQCPMSSFDEIFHLVPEDRDDNDPFYIEIDITTNERIYWLSPMGTQYSAFKTDVEEI